MSEDKRDNFRREFLFGIGIHSFLLDPHENTVGISIQNLGEENLFQPSRHNRDNDEG
jgi:hypothetical protein